MLNSMFCVLQLRNYYGMCNLYVASINLLYHLENIMLLNAMFSEFSLECQGSNIFTKRPLSFGTNGLPTSGIHLTSENASNKYP